MGHRLQRYWQHSHWTTQEAVAAMLLFCMLIVVALAACDTTAAGAQNPPPTQQVQKCGNVQTNPMGIPQNTAAAKQAATCFWQAYQKCQPATLGFSESSIDTLAFHTFSIRSNGQKCSITDVIQHTVVPSKRPTTRTYTCTGVAVKSDGLHFSGCGDEGDIVVPM